MTRRIKGWHIEATCPDCGGTLSHIADGIPSETSSRAITECTSCQRRFCVQINLIDATKELGARPRHPNTCICASCTNAIKGRTHGTPSAYNAGCRCEDCKRATRDASRRYRAAKRKSVA
jgi:hypothetical protein